MRKSEGVRTTKETDITCLLDLDGKGDSVIDTGIGFFDHMMTAFSKHGFFDLTMKIKGDLKVDTHHTVEDAGIVLGDSIYRALGDKKGIRRYGSCIIPMDEALVLCAVDLCDRPYLSYDLKLNREKVGDLETETIREFFYAISYSSKMNLHLHMISGSNEHHIIEASFKAFARALNEAVSIDPRIDGVLSTKGLL